MRSIPDTIKSLVLAAVLVILSVSANAQYKKALSSGKTIGMHRDAPVNVGILGGADYTYWYHAPHLQASDWYLYQYQPQFRLGYFGGIAVEYLIHPAFSVGFNAIYNRHNLRMQYIDSHFPSHWDAAQQSIIFVERTYTLEADYQALEAYLPLTVYYTMRLNKNIKPFFYIAPRASYTLAGEMSLKKTDLLAGSTTPTPYSSESKPFADTLRFNYGATAGLGAQFKIDWGSYYLLVKFDISASIYLRQTFNQMDLNNEFNYKRYFTNAQATLSFMLPMKKQLKDACYYFNK